ncbi:DUF2108 domain-containing protein [Methanopyrus sp.]
MNALLIASLSACAIGTVAAVLRRDPVRKLPGLALAKSGMIGAVAAEGYLDVAAAGAAMEAIGTIMFCVYLIRIEEVRARGE